MLIIISNKIIHSYYYILCRSCLYPTSCNCCICASDIVKLIIIISKVLMHHDIVHVCYILDKCINVFITVIVDFLITCTRVTLNILTLLLFSLRNYYVCNYLVLCDIIYALSMRILRIIFEFCSTKVNTCIY